jgi:hypothetical protein
MYIVADPECLFPLRIPVPLALFFLTANFNERLKNMFKNKNIYLAIGQISMAISILLNHFVEESGPISFIIGFLTGFAIVFTIAFIMLLRKEKISN